MQTDEAIDQTDISIWGRPDSGRALISHKNHRITASSRFMFYFRPLIRSRNAVFAFIIAHNRKKGGIGVAGRIKKLHKFMLPHNSFSARLCLSFRVTYAARRRWSRVAFNLI